MNDSTHQINVADIDDAILMLNRHTDEPSIRSLVSILEALKLDLYNESLLEQLADTWRNLGVCQGTVLTYVPFFYMMIPDDIFGDDKE